MGTYGLTPVSELSSNDLRLEVEGFIRLSLDCRAEGFGISTKEFARFQQCMQRLTEEKIATPQEIEAMWREYRGER
jgi:hypothetical protein